jgi:hypothetical protein
MQLPRQIPPYLTPVSSSLDLPSPPISQFVNNDDANFHISVTSPIPFNEQHSSSKRSIKEAYSFKDDVSCEEESHAPSESEAEDELPDEDQTRIFSDEGAGISCIVHRPDSILIMAVLQTRPRDGLRRVPRGAWILANLSLCQANEQPMVSGCSLRVPENDVEIISQRLQHGSCHVHRARPVSLEFVESRMV